MVDRISGSAISSLLRAQTTGVTAGIAALKNNQQAQQAIINQLQKSADEGKQLVAQSAQGTQSPAQLPPGTSLPRGSLIDILA